MEFRTSTDVPGVDVPHDRTEARPGAGERARERRFVAKTSTTTEAPAGLAARWADRSRDERLRLLALMNTGERRLFLLLMHEDCAAWEADVRAWRRPEPARMAALASY